MNSEEHSTGNTKLFFDTYALIKIYQADDSYLSYVDKPFFITKLNLFEFHQFLLRVKNEALADAEIAKYRRHIKEIDLKVIIHASKFRAESKNKDLSMTDCIGYIYAKQNRLVFLTGDRQFKGMENVEFVN